MVIILIKKKPPEKGLSVARMLAHITYLSEEAFKENLEEIYKTSCP